MKLPCAKFHDPNITFESHMTWCVSKLERFDQKVQVFIPGLVNNAKEETKKKI